MIKNFIILILIVLLGFTSYLLYDSAGNRINFWPLGGHENKSGPNEPPKKPDLQQEDIFVKEALPPDVTPEPFTDPTISLNLDIKKDKNQADTGTLVFRYSVIHPTVIKVTDSKGSTAAEINLETGETVFSSGYTPDSAGLEFWKSIAESYPEVCPLVENATP